MRGRSTDGVGVTGGPEKWRSLSAVVLRLVLPAGLALACAHRPALVSPADCAAAQAEAARLSAIWEGRRLAGIVQITARDGLLRDRAIATIATVPPNRLRIEVSDDLGQTQLLALVSGDALAFWTVRDGWLNGVPVLAALPLPAATWPHLPRLLLALPCAAPECASSSKNTGKPMVLLRCGHGTPEWQWDPQRQQVAGARLPPLRISYLDADRGNGLHPRDLDVDLGEGRSLSVRWQQFRFDREFPPDLFRLRQPETAPATGPSMERP
ncbi:MAG TPA: hypothetical protein VGB12_05610 [bacterium]